MYEFDDFESTQKNILNGKMSQFMDAYIRQHKVWTPEQMQSDFIEKIESEIRNGDYIPDPKYIEYLTHENKIFLEKKLNAIKWLTCNNGKTFSLNRFTQKYIKHKPIADRKSPIVERIRFGMKWDENSFYDINFGLKQAFRFRETSVLENIKHQPWTVEHVNSELSEKYNCNIITCLDKLLAIWE